MTHCRNNTTNGNKITQYKAKTTPHTITINSNSKDRSRAVSHVYSNRASLSLTARSKTGDISIIVIRNKQKRNLYSK